MVLHIRRICPNDLIQAGIRRYKNYLRMKKIKILIVEDHEIVIKGIKALLEPYKELEVVGYALESEDARKKMEKLKPDIVIMDINLPGISGIELTKIITKEHSSTKVIYYTSHVDEELVTRGFEAGAYGYVPKDFRPEELIEAIHLAINGQKFMKGIVSEKFISSYLKFEKEKKLLEDMPLSGRELEVLKCLSQGLSNNQIAEKLSVSMDTVEKHKNDLMKKLNIYSTAELIIYAIFKSLMYGSPYGGN